MQDIEKNMYTKILLAGVQSELSLGRKASQVCMSIRKNVDQKLQIGKK